MSHLVRIKIYIWNGNGNGNEINLLSVLFQQENQSRNKTKKIQGIMLKCNFPITQLPQPIGFCHLYTHRPFQKSMLHRYIITSKIKIQMLDNEYNTFSVNILAWEGERPKNMTSKINMTRCTIN